MDETIVVLTPGVGLSAAELAAAWNARQGGARARTRRTARRRAVRPGRNGFSRRQDWSDAQLLESFPTLRQSDLAQVWAYAAVHPADIERALREQEAA